MPRTLFVLVSLALADRAGAGWTDPRPLQAPINSAGAEWFPTLASNGTIYFARDRVFRVFRAIRGPSDSRLWLSRPDS